MSDMNVDSLYSNFPVDLPPDQILARLRQARDQGVDLNTSSANVFEPQQTNHPPPSCCSKLKKPTRRHGGA